MINLETINKKKTFIIFSFLLGFFIVTLPYQKIFFALKIYNIISFILLFLIIFFYNQKKKLFLTKQSYLYFLTPIVVFLPILLFNIYDEAKTIEIFLKLLNISILIFLIFFIFLNNLVSYFIKGFIFATAISAFFAINQFYKIEFFYDIRYLFETVNVWGDYYYILRPPGLAYTSIQLSVTLLISTSLLFYIDTKSKLERKYFYIVFVILLATPFLIKAKILVVTNFVLLLCYFFIKKKNFYNKYFVSITLIIYLFFLSIFIITNFSQYSRGIIEKLGLASVNFKNEVSQLKVPGFKNLKDQKEYEYFKNNCKLSELYENKNIDCKNLSYKEYLVIKKNVTTENLIPVFLNYSSHNSNINSLVFGGTFYFISTVLFKLILFFKTLSQYLKTRKLDYLISFSFLFYLEIYTNFHNAGLSTLSILYIPFYFLIFLQILYKKNLSS